MEPPVNRIERAIMVVLVGGCVAACPALSVAQQEPARSAFPDDSVVASDTLARAGELDDGGNSSEAVRVLQQLLLAEPDKVLATSADRLLYVPVRSVVYAFLLSRPELLRKYRVQEEPEAANVLAKGDMEGVERSRFLTTSGLEAAMRIAQRRLEMGQFEAARLALDDVPAHPDFSGENAAEVGRLAAEIAVYLPRPEVVAWAEALGGKPGDAVEWPAALRRTMRSSLHPSVAVAEELPRSVPLAGDTFRGTGAEAGGPVPAERRDGARSFGRSWVFPTVVGESVIVNDGLTVRAMDRATLVPLWELLPDGASVRDFADELAAAGNTLGREIEDAATVTVAEDIAVATTGIPVGGSRVGDQRVHAMSAVDGTPMWSVDPSWLDSRLAEATVRGPAVIQDGTVVLSMRKQANFRRLTSLYLAGLDLYSGRLLWVRHVASIGSLPWGRSQSRPEATVSDRGMVFRGDEMGVLTAVEAATGRPRWVRLLTSTKPFDPPYRSAEAPPPRDMVTPVVWGDTLIYLEAEGGDIVQVSTVDGRRIATRNASALAGPRYLVKVGDMLAGVGVNRVAFVPLNDFANGTVRLSGPLPSTGGVGRALATGATLTVPLATGLAVIDPRTPDNIRTVPLSASGNVIVSDSVGGDSHLLVADGDRLYSYIGWEVAEARLTERLRANPSDAPTIRTFMEIANRAGRNDRLRELAERAVALAIGPDGEAESQEALFSLLLKLVRAGTPREDERGATLPLKPLEDGAHVDGMLEALERCANTPRQSVEQSLELAAHREAGDRPQEAVEAYQRVLEDASLSRVVLAGQRLPTLAGVEARQRLEALLERTGPGPYAAFDRQAEAELAGLNPEAGAGVVALIAERYPAAERGTEMWLLASERAAAVGDAGFAAASVGRAVRAARVSELIGRTVDPAVWGRVASAAVRFGEGREAAAYRFLRSLAARDAALVVSVDGVDVGITEVVKSFRERLALAPSRPRVAPLLENAVHQVIAGWAPVEAVGTTPIGCPADQVFMVSESAREFALWSEQLEDDRLAPAWVRPILDADPVPLRATADESVVFWPVSGGGVVECIDNLTGETRWKTIDLAEAMEGGQASQRRFPKLSTPLDGTVDATDLLVANDSATVVLVQRTGRAVAFDLASGATLWTGSVGAARVFDVQLCGDILLVSGAGELEKGADGQGRLAPVLASVSLKTGEALGAVAPEQLGEHVRWIRPLVGKNGSGDAIVATAAGLLRVQPRTASVVWSVGQGPGAGSAAGWIVGGSVFVLDNESRLHQFRTADGSRAADPLETRGKIEFPLAGETFGERLMVASSMGVLLYESDGTLTGTDAIQSAGRLMMPLLGRGGIVAMEAYADPSESDREDDLQGIRIFVLDDESARLTDSKRISLPDAPRGLMLLDKKVLIRSGRATLVLLGN